MHEVRDEPSPDARRRVDAAQDVGSDDSQADGPARPPGGGRRDLFLAARRRGEVEMGCRLHRAMKQSSRERERNAREVMMDSA